MAPLNIATFGSCLSRYTANYYVRLFGGKIFSSVYHNRSDAFVGRYIEKTLQIGEYSKILNFLSNSDEYTPDSLPTNILKNQFKQYMGKHRLSKGTPFLEGLNDNLYDIIIMDNYMDLSAKLISYKEEFSHVFLKIGDIKINSDDLAIHDILSPIEAITNTYKIINCFREKSPKSRIVFMHFPYNTYSNNPDRVYRSKQFEKNFQYPGIDILPTLTVPKIFQTKVRQHFKPQQYCAYAGMIHNLILQ